MVIRFQLATHAALVCLSPLVEYNPVSRSALRPFSPPHLSHTRGIISLSCPLITYGPNLSQFWLLLSLMRADSHLRDAFSFPRCFIRRTLELLGAFLLWAKAKSKHHLSAFVATSLSNAKWCLKQKGHKLCLRKSHISVKLVTCHRCAVNEWRKKLCTSFSSQKLMCWRSLCIRFAEQEQGGTQPTKSWILNIRYCASTISFSVINQRKSCGLVMLFIAISDVLHVNYPGHHDMC